MRARAPRHATGHPPPRSTFTCLPLTRPAGRREWWRTRPPTLEVPMRKHRRHVLVLAALLAHASLAHAQQTITFATDPFALSSALTTPGRQIDGNELLTTFDPATDVF